MQVLGQINTRVVSSYLEDKYSMKIEDTFDNPQVLDDALESVIDGGRRIIERQILRLIYDKIGVESSSAMTLDFVSKLAEARRLYEGSRTQQKD